MSTMQGDVTNYESTPPLKLNTPTCSHNVKITYCRIMLFIHNLAIYILIQVKQTL